MKQTIKQAADTILDYSVNRAGGTPGVVAMHRRILGLADFAVHGRGVLPGLC